MKRILSLRVMIFYLLLSCSTTSERILSHSSVHNKKALLELSVSPSDSRIFINGLPWDGEPLEKGVHRVLIEHSGYKPKSHLISIQDVSRISLEIQLEPDDRPLHFFYPQEEKFIVRHSQGTESFVGSFNSNIPRGPVEILTNDGVRLYKGVHQAETFIHRCPQNPTQKSFCVKKHALPSAPSSMVFHNRSLWYTVFSMTKDVYEYNLDKGTTIKHFELAHKSRLYVHYEKIYILLETGVLKSYHPSTKHLETVAELSADWLIDMAIVGDNILAISWLKNLYVQKNKEKEEQLYLSRPKKILLAGEAQWIMQAEPAGLFSIQKKTGWSDPKRVFRQGFWDESRNGFWLLDEKKNQIVFYSEMKHQLEESMTLSFAKGEATNFVQTDDRLIVSLHFTGTGFSLGKGEIHIYDKETFQLLDTITGLKSPVHLEISSDDTLAVGDISGKSIEIYDIQELRK